MIIQSVNEVVGIFTSRNTWRTFRLVMLVRLIAKIMAPAKSAETSAQVFLTVFAVFFFFLNR